MESLSAFLSGTDVSSSAVSSVGLTASGAASASIGASGSTRGDRLDRVAAGHQHEFAAAGMDRGRLDAVALATQVIEQATALQQVRVDHQAVLVEGGVHQATDAHAVVAHDLETNQRGRI